MDLQSEEVFLYKLVMIQYRGNSDCYNVLIINFPILFSWRVSYIIYPFLGHLIPTLVAHLCLHLSACPLDTLSGFSVNCGSQDNTIQGSSQHKCS